MPTSDDMTWNQYLVKQKELRKQIKQLETQSFNLAKSMVKPYANYAIGDRIEFKAGDKKYQGKIIGVIAESKMPFIKYTVLEHSIGPGYYCAYEENIIRKLNADEKL